MKYVADDVLVGMFYFFPEEKRQFTHDRVKMHRFFYDRKDEYRVLNCMGFRIRGHPESFELDQAYSNLTATWILRPIGHKFNPHLISESVDDCFERHIQPILTDKEVSELERLSKEFQEEFSDKAA